MQTPADGGLYLYKDLYENEVKKNEDITREVEELRRVLDQTEVARSNCIETLREVLGKIGDLELFIHNMAHKL